MNSKKNTNLFFVPSKMVFFDILKSFDPMGIITTEKAAAPNLLEGKSLPEVKKKLFIQINSTIDKLLVSASKLHKKIPEPYVNSKLVVWQIRFNKTVRRKETRYYNYRFYFKEKIKKANSKKDLIKLYKEFKEIEKDYKKYHDEIDRWVKSIIDPTYTIFNNNPKGKEKATPDDPQALALTEIANKKHAREASILLGLIKKYWNEEVALKFYNKCWKGRYFNLVKLRQFLNKKNARDKLGFYYGTRKITWKPVKPWGNLNAINWFTKRQKTFNVTGWWIKNNRQKQSNFVNSHLPTEKFDKALRRGLQGDQFITFKRSLLDALPKIQYVLYNNKLPGNYLRRSKNFHIGIRDPMLLHIEIEEFEKESKIDKKKVKKDLVKELSETHNSSWGWLLSYQLAKMNQIFGRNCGSYKYFYSKKDNRIYFIKLQGAKVDPKHFGGYITIKNNAVTIWHGMDKANTKELFKSKIGNLPH